VVGPTRGAYCTHTATPPTFAQQKKRRQSWNVENFLVKIKTIFPEYSIENLYNQVVNLDLHKRDSSTKKVFKWPISRYKLNPIP
jgi:hypothetical protein